MNLELIFINRVLWLFSILRMFVVVVLIYVIYIFILFFRSGLELIASKWAHSLIELDLAWANVQQPLDNALRALADKGAESRLA